MGSEALLQRFAAKRIELRETRTRQKTDWATGTFPGKAPPQDIVLPHSLTEFRQALQGHSTNA
jgi:hypothetical protein